MKPKKKIKIKFVGFFEELERFNDFVNLLTERYDIEYSDNPDYLFYSVFSLDYLKYRNCIRIFFTGECIIPNFNECDYAIGFDRIEFGDRYLRMPLYSLFQYRKTYESLLNRCEISKDVLSSKKGFCTFVVSNGFAQESRVKFYHLLSQYKKVDSGGRYLNNIGGAIKDKIEFLSTHKFNIAFENYRYEGYTTEKLVDAFASRTVPIYLGDPAVVEDFNENSFVNVSNYKTLDDAVKRIIELDSDEEEYLKVLNAPVIRNYHSLVKLRDFLYNIFDQNLEEARRRPIAKDQIRYENMLLRHKFFEEHIYMYYRRFISLIKQLRAGSIISKRRTI